MPILSTVLPVSSNWQWRAWAKAVSLSWLLRNLWCNEWRVTYLITYLLPYLLTYLLTSWSRVLLEKPTGSQLVEKFPTFYGTRRFITSFTSARQLSLSWASSIQSIPPHSTSWRFIIISSHLRIGLPSVLFPSGFTTTILYTPLPHMRYMTRPSHSRFYHPNNIGWGVQMNRESQNI
jgi:hypothetical protein